MDIFSKRDGPRPQDVQAKRLISQNADKICMLADQLSNGGYSRMRQQQARRREEPKPDGLVIHDLKAPVARDDLQPYIRISLNGRVVLTDQSSGLQIQLLGEIRGGFMSKRFVLATKENGFFSPIDDETLKALSHLQDAALTLEFGEKELAAEVGKCLGLEQ